MGDWVYRDEWNHKCDKPGWAQSTKVGDVWRCECGQYYRVKQVDGDFREPWLVWEETTEVTPNKPRADDYYGGIYAPGTK